MGFQAIPVLRIFDEDKAREFYLGFLGMTLDWAHRFDDDAPLYMQVSKGERPAIEVAPWGDRCFTLTDPFANRILFNERSS